MANPFPFVSGNVLEAAQLNGVGESATFTPSISNLTLGNGISEGRFVRVNKLVYFRVRIVFGSTTSVDAGAKDLTLPIVATNATTFDGLHAMAHYFDTSATLIVFNQPLIVIGDSSLRLGAANVSGTYSAFNDLSSTVPFTWATGDGLTITGTYQVA